MRSAVRLLLGVFAAFLAGCQQSSMITVTAEADPTADFSQYHTLAVSTETDVAARQAYLAQRVTQAITDELLTHNYQPLAQVEGEALAPSDAVTSEELAHVARNAMIGKGLTLNPADPKLLLTIDNLSGSFTYAVPLREIRISSDAADDRSPLDTRGAILADSRTAKLPVRAIAICLYDPRRPDKPVWRATAVSLHDARSLRALAPGMIDALLAEYPNPSGKPVRRQIPRSTATNP